MKVGLAIPVLAVGCLAGADAEKLNRNAAKAPMPPAQVQTRPDHPQKGNVKQNGKPNAKQDANFGSAETLIKLLKLSPEQRNKALAPLPPARRQQIEKRLDVYQKMPEVERARALDRLKRMQSLPPQRQQQVRASVTRLQALPAPRHAVVQRQLNQLRILSDVDRSALMNSEEFRSKFTPAEQQIIADICLVTPQN
jgi:hypothetical protein